MVERRSALAGQVQTGRFGRPGAPGSVMQTVDGLTLHQVAAWTQSLRTVEAALVQHVEADEVAGPGLASIGKKGAMLRIEPLKWWILDTAPLTFEAEQAVVLDLSHARSHVRIGGPKAEQLLNRHCPLDLRPHAFPLNSVASTMMHHVGITLWHSTEGYELFIPRGFALSIWQVLSDTALQFGLEVGA